MEYKITHFWLMLFMHSPLCYVVDETEKESFVPIKGLKPNVCKLDW